MGAGHSHHDHAANRRRMLLTLGLVLVYMVAEVVGGLASGSLALLADAGHMLSDAGALVVSLLAMRIAQRPASQTHTFGYQRAEILAALGNAAVLVAISGVIVYEAIARLGAPPEVHGGVLLGIASGGLVINLIGLWLLHGGRSGSLNVRGAWLHVLGDALGSAGAIAAGVLIAAFGWRWADPVASILIAALVLYSAWSLMADTVRVLMQAVPGRIDLEALDRALNEIEGVIEVHDLHVWSLTSGRDVMSAHLTVASNNDRPLVVAAVKERLHDEFDLHHSTIQVDCDGECEPCRPLEVVQH